MTGKRGGKERPPAKPYRLIPREIYAEPIPCKEDSIPGAGQEE